MPWEVARDRLRVLQARGLAESGVWEPFYVELSDILRRYVEQVSAELPGVRLLFMQSNGGLTAPEALRASNAVLSGPAGGLVATARIAEASGRRRLIAFDMGGTSTDVALYDGALPQRFETGIAGVMLESFIEAGRQDIVAGQPLVYGQSVTDACMSWDTTATLLTELAAATHARRG